MNDPMSIRRLYGRRQNHALRAGQAELSDRISELNDRVDTLERPKPARPAR